MITIRHTYVFAGETTSEERRVPKSSAEARLYLEAQQPQRLHDKSSTDAAAAKPTPPPLRRPKKRVSMFDPAMSGASQQQPLSTSATAETTTMAALSSGIGGGSAGGVASAGGAGFRAAAAAAAPKLNTIEKSRLDWAGYVDREGIGDELDEHSRAKEGYLGRMDFLGRVQANRDEMRKGRL
jgi:hypothetical protein